MTRPLFLFRPEPGWTHSARRARDLGLVIDGAPLFGIEAAQWSAPAAALFDGLLVGSANVFRHGGAELASLISLPVYAVGESTAKAARASGFAVAGAGSGNLQSLIDSLGRQLRLLRLTGEVHVSLRPVPGISIEERVVYRAVPRAIGPNLAERLKAGGVVALHSGEAALKFASECARLDLDRSRLAIAALAPRIAAAAGRGWEAVHTAERMTDSELLVLAKGLCQTA